MLLYYENLSGLNSSTYCSLMEHDDEKIMDLVILFIINNYYDAFNVFFCALLSNYSIESRFELNHFTNNVYIYLFITSSFFFARKYLNVPT